MGRVTFDYRTLANFEAEWLLTRILCTKKPWQIWNILVNKTPHSNQNLKIKNKKVVQSLPPKFLREITIFPWKNNNNKNIKERKGKKKVEVERERVTVASAVDGDVLTGYGLGTGSGSQNFLLHSHLCFSVFAFFGLGFCSIQHSTSPCPFTPFILFFFFILDGIYLFILSNRIFFFFFFQSRKQAELIKK